MQYIVRPMTQEDVPQVTAIDREAFPTMWPPMNYQRELENHLAHYIVVAEESDKTSEPPTTKIEANTGLAHKVVEWLTPHKAGPEPPQKIVGFAGFWMMAGEAHIISLAVKKEFRRRGFGKLLLVELVRAAVKIEAEIVTLEVRVSNYEAQRLYLQYGFIGKGVRRAYYTDNREDALIMTLDDADSSQCVAKFEEWRNSLKFGL
ncbi:ribosomal-protein-alanine N-acetyltransferase [Dehalogenimonas formicexedens]|uniref:Ribosomal-protein-alanine N-acetyltransferase n=1 Tax=Dehalogenimonas formicexedens TaxID=1839801 RepID=A0A1P8F762_9CHLR|nr:ribosomal protein S18-alanine N-acetyltransferase [Dehalogenimonas formicexedens]APV44290.1 ribosomal-protein-alanine N-acetyltransferase [Dehalogenimonas formicexedens]